jgi:cytochrome c oxidase subunit 2
MIFQNVVWTIALVGMGLVALGFIHVIRQAGKPADDEATRKAAHTSNVLRRWLFAALLIIFVGGSYATLRNFPIPPQHTALGIQQVVDVVGQQWSWQINPKTVHAGSPVEFRVTSKDVNHGFAIYAPDGHIATQTQAMPGFTNKIVHTFMQPGTYTVMCLEYCGIGHAPMTAEFTVVAASGG